MADAINTGGIRPVTLPNQFPPMPAVARILSRFDRAQLHGFIAVALDLADAMDGDPDLEEDDYGEPAGDELDHSWPEWHTRDKRKTTSAGYEMAPVGGVGGVPSYQPTEDDEDDDPQEEDDDSGQCTEDEISAGDRRFGTRGPGCVISDEGGCEHDGTEPRDYYPLRPRYGDDQSKGPINQVEIARDHHRRLMTDPNYN